MRCLPILTLLACSSARTETLEETFTDSAGLSGRIALVLPEEKEGASDPGVLFFFTGDFGDSEYVEEFLQKRLVGELGVDPERVFTTGLSGGSDFAAAFHFQADYHYRGGAVALCGGDVVRTVSRSGRG